MDQNNPKQNLFYFMPLNNQPVQQSSSFVSMFNTAPINQTNLQKGYGKELKCFVQKNESAHQKGLFSFPSNQQKKQEPKQEVQIVRKTNLYQDSQGPWIGAPLKLKSQFQQQLVQSNTFHFPTNLSSLFVQPTNMTPSIFNSCCLKFQECTCKPIPDYICYNCIRTCGTIKYVICEKCFEPEQHEGHFYQKHKQPDSRFGQRSQTCVCGKDLFSEDQKVIRCKNHSEQLTQEQKLAEKTIIEKETQHRLKKLIDIVFYLQKELRSFSNIEVSIQKKYFLFWGEILDLLNLYAKSGEQNLGIVLTLLFQIKFKFIEDEYKQRDNEFRSNFYGNNTQKQKQSTLIQYILGPLKLLHNSKNFCLQLCESHKFLNLFTTLFISFCLSAQKHYLWLIYETPYACSILNIKYLERYYERGISALDQKCKRVFFQKHEKYYEYGLKYFKQTMSKKRNFVHPVVNYLDNMDVLFSFFQDVPIGPFLKFMGSQLLVEFLFCYVRVHLHQQHQDSFDREHYDENQSRSRWSSCHEPFYKIINKIMISLCDRTIQNLADYYLILQKVQKILQKTEQQPKQQINEGEKKDSKEEKELIQMNQVENKVEQGFDKQSIPAQDSNESEQKTKANRKDLLGNFEYYKNSFIRNVKYRLFETESKERILRSEINQTQSQSKLNDLMLIVFASKYPNNQQVVSNRNQNKQIFGSETRYRANTKALWSDMKIYKTIRSLLFFWFNLKQLNLTSRKLNQENNEQKNESLVKSLFFYDKVFTSQELLKLKKNTNISKFYQFVQKHLVFNFQTKKFYFNQQTISLSDINPFFKILSRTPDHLGFNDYKYIQQGIENNGFKNYLYDILISSGIIQDQRHELQTLYNSQKEWIQNFKMFVFLLMIGNAVANGSNEFISNTIKQIKQQNYFIFKGSISESEKDQVFEIVFGRKKQNQLAKELHERQLPQSKQTNQGQFLSKKEDKQKLINEKRHQFLQKQGINISIQEYDETVCAICREKSSSENQFVYPIKIETNKTVAYSFFNEIDRAGIDIKINFTQHHFSCLVNSDPSNNKTSKQFIPVNYNKNNKKMNRRFHNMLVLSMLNPFEMENSFLPLFKFLVESKVFSSMINVHLYEKAKKKRQKTEKFVFNFLTDMYQHSADYMKEQYTQSILNLLNEARSVKAGGLAQVQLLFIDCLFSRIKKESIVLDSQRLIKIFSLFSQQEFEVFKREFQEIGVADLSQLSQHLGQQFSTAQISKQYPLRLPKYAKQLPLFKNQLCDMCKVHQRASICLICGFTSCQSCTYYSSFHDSLHSNKKIQLIISQGTVKHHGLVSQNNSFYHFHNESFSLYYNQLMIPLSQIPLIEQQSEIIELNEVLYLGIAELLLQ